MPDSPLDAKALATIAILMDRRDRWAVITYGDLGKRLDHPVFGLGQILDRVGRWCGSIRKRSLALLVIDEEEGKPRYGMFGGFPGEVEPVTPETYDQLRTRLWRENWDGITLPTLDQIAEAYANN